MTEKKISARDIAHIALFTALMAVCAWIMVPFAVPFTMQTFAVMLAASVLGTKRALISLLLYLGLGMIGIPVFSGFTGGFGVLAGPTGGYLIGFLPMVLIASRLIGLMGRKMWMLCIAFACGLLVCYAFGTVWYALIYMRGAGFAACGAALLECVVPFLVPDAAKLLLAAWVARRLDKIVRK